MKAAGEGSVGGLDKERWWRRNCRNENEGNERNKTMKGNKCSSGGRDEKMTEEEREVEDIVKVGEVAEEGQKNGVEG